MIRSMNSLMLWLLNKASKASGGAMPKAKINATAFCFKNQQKAVASKADLTKEDWYFTEYQCADYTLRSKCQNLTAISAKVFEAMQLPIADYGVTFKNLKPHRGGIYNVIDIRDNNGFIRFTIVPRTGYREFHSIGQRCQAYIGTQYFAADTMKELLEKLRNYTNSKRVQK